MARKRIELTAHQQCAVDRFIARHLNPSPGRTPQDLTARLQHWISIANDPSQIVSGLDAKGLANARRKARQNVRRLILGHPELAGQTIATQPEVSQ